MLNRRASILFLSIFVSACNAGSPTLLPPPTVLLAPAASPTVIVATATATRAAPPTATNAQATQPLSGLPPAFKKFLSNVQVEIQGDSIVLKSNSLPPHPSPYFPRSDSRYQAYSGSNTNYRQNPNEIREQSLVIMIPLNPKQDTRHTPTPLGPIGMALDGVALFNQYAGPNQPLTNEINSFDQFNGHPQQEGMYHYHVEPLFLMAKFGKDSLIGFLLDGFPVYGPQESGKTIMSKDLDQFHGHTHPTADYPNGIYHYHVTVDAPYINGNGFYGVAGPLVR